MRIKEAGLYGIYDRVSGEFEAPITEMREYIHALRAFKSFVDNSKVNAKEFQLIRVGLLSEDKTIVNDEHFVICSGDVIDDVIKDYVTSIIGDDAE